MRNFDRDNRRRSWGDKIRAREGSVVTGLFLLLFGVVFLLRQMDVSMPGWLFKWEFFMILDGLFIGVRQNFKGPMWFILITIGSVSMADEILPGLNIRHYAWPIIIIIVGLFLILRPKPSKNTSIYNGPEESTVLIGADDASSFGGERLDATAIFGSVKKVVVSKNFKGGESVAIMGGVEINLSQADIHGRVSLEATNLMGGTKLIVPPTWDVRSEMVAIFGGVEDKRDIHNLKIDPSKTLVLEGTCVFGGLEIRAY